MAKARKKRTKRYQGADAKLAAPSITRVSAEERSAFKEWWLQYGTITRIISVIFGVAAALVVLLIGIVGLF